MHLIKATMLKAILAGAAATATVSTGVVLTVAVVEFSTGNYADASKEIEIEGEDQTFNAETYVSPIIVSQENNDDTDSYFIDTTDSNHEIDDIGAVHDNITAVANISIGNSVKTADTSMTADSSLASVTGNTGNGSALAGNTVNASVNIDNVPGSTVDNTVNTAVDTSNSSVNSAADTDNGSVSTAAYNGNGSVNTAVNVDNNALSAVDVGNSPVYTAVNSDNGNDTASSSATSLPDYHHSTSIYDDDGALLRVEYYVEDQNLPAEYSDVTDYDKDTNSYTETVYRYDEENEVEVVVRTDTYVGGELVSSEVP